jgi:hypothetical protein
MCGHAQVPVKVNAQVDAGIADVVSLLNQIEGLQTIESCQGDSERRSAYVYFWYGDWEEVARFVFESLEPCLCSEIRTDYNISVEVFAGSRPVGKLEFRPEATAAVASVLKQIVSIDRNSVCHGGKPSTTLRS